jgi:hypothetical protein
MSCEVVHYNSRLWVTAAGRLLGGYSAGALRSYVFPLYSPSGALVVQEGPADHPHHQGIWAGLEVDGIDLWNAGSFDVPRHRQEMVGELADIVSAVTSNGVVFAHDTRWVEVDGAELLRERRTVSLKAHADATIVDWQSVFHHPDKRTRLGQTKESGLGLRVPPHWETRFGGRIRNAAGAAGEPGCFDRMSPWLAIEGAAGGAASAGVVMVPGSAPCPWFTRDYGCHVYNPARHGAIALASGETLVWSMRVLAYDGARSVADIDALVAAPVT